MYVYSYKQSIFKFSKDQIENSWLKDINFLIKITKIIKKNKNENWFDLEIYSRYSGFQKFSAVPRKERFHELFRSRNGFEIAK